LNKTSTKLFVFARILLSHPCDCPIYRTIGFKWHDTFLNSISYSNNIFFGFLEKIPILRKTRAIEFLYIIEIKGFFYIFDMVRNLLYLTVGMVENT